MSALYETDICLLLPPTACSLRWRRRHSPNFKNPSTPFAVGGAPTLQRPASSFRREVGTPGAAHVKFEPGCVSGSPRPGH